MVVMPPARPPAGDPGRPQRARGGGGGRGRYGGAGTAHRLLHRCRARQVRSKGLGVGRKPVRRLLRRHLL